MLRLTLQIPSDQEPIRGDLAVLTELRKSWPALSRRSLKPLFEQGKIRLREKPLPAHLLLSPGSYAIDIDLEPSMLQAFASAPRASASPQGCFLPILYEDADLLVLHKSSGIPSAPQEPSETQTAVSAALARQPTLRGVGFNELEPGLVHRLDTGTSGILVFARNAPEFTRLRELWQGREVVKIYRAITHTPLAAPQTIELALAHDAKSAKKMRALPADSPAHLRAQTRGKPLRALTHIEACEGMGGTSYLDGTSYYDARIRIETGVTHQIRAHLAHLKAPIAGDAVYGGRESARLWLHAWKLAFPLRSGTWLELTASLPSDWPGTL